MRVTLIMTTTADGFISRSAQDPSEWTETYDQYFFDAKTREIGTVIMGANTYRMLSGPFDGRLNIVLSSNAEGHENIPNVLEFHSGEPAEVLDELEKRDIHEVALIGGSQINGSFLLENLVDEIYLTVTPQLFGRGLSIGSERDLETQLELADVKEMEDGSAIIHYLVQN